MGTPDISGLNKKPNPDISVLNSKRALVYEDIFGGVNKQLSAIRIFMKVSRQREVVLDALRK